MNVIEEVLRWDNHWRPEEAEYSASEIASNSDYQLWLSKLDTPKTYILPLDNSVASKVGTGFHMIAEEAMQNKVNVFTEKQMVGKIGDFVVSGTPDIIYKDGDHWIVGDYKTKGSYQMKKALLEGVEDVKVQMSIYAYLFSLELDVPMPTVGEVYLIHVGDKGYFSKADCAKLGLPEKSTIPKYETKRITLMSKDELVSYINLRLDLTEEPLVDCVGWRCGYCSYDCTYRKES